MFPSLSQSINGVNWRSRRCAREPPNSAVWCCHAVDYICKVSSKVFFFPFRCLRFRCHLSVSRLQHTKKTTNGQFRWAIRETAKCSWKDRDWLRNENSLSSSGSQWSSNCNDWTWLGLSLELGEARSFWMNIWVIIKTRIFHQSLRHCEASFWSSKFQYKLQLT